MTPQRHIASGIFVFLFLLLIAGGRAAAQAPIISPDRSFDTIRTVDEQEQWRAGVYAGFNRNLYAPGGMEGLPEVPNCCPAYNEGGGQGIAFGAVASVPFTDGMSAGMRLIYETFDGQLRALEYETVNYQRGSALGTFEHTIDIRLAAISFEPHLLLDGPLGINFFGGVRADLVITNEYDQREVFLEPEGLTFENGKRVRMEFSGSIPQNQPIMISAIAGANYFVTLNADGDLIAGPWVTGWYGITKPVSETPWSIHGLQIGVSLQFVNLLRTETIEIRETTPTPGENRPPMGTEPPR